MYEDLVLAARSKKRTMAWHPSPSVFNSSVNCLAMIGRYYALMRSMAMVVCVCGAPASSLMAQRSGGATDGPQKISAPEKEDLAPAPAKVDVNPVARDEEIRTRLQSVLDATGWFTEPLVRVKEGVVFLSGRSRPMSSRNGQAI